MLFRSFVRRSSGDEEVEVVVCDGILVVATEACTFKNLVEVLDGGIRKSPRVDSADRMVCSAQSTPFSPEVAEYGTRSCRVGKT